MESLARLVVYMFLAIAAIVFVIAFLLTRYTIKKKFPNMHWAWYFLVVPGVMAVSFGIGLLLLKMIASINA
jgi:hypothetical protein